MNEVVECIEKFGIREVAFLDPTFTIKRKWVLDFCQKLADRDLDLNFTMRTRPDLLDPEMLRMLALAGCVRISLGIESCEPKILNHLNRDANVEKIQQAVEWIQAEGIMGFGYFMIGNKGETHKTLRTTLDQVKTMPLHFAQFFQALPLPDTEIWQGSKRELGIDIWEEISHGRYPTADQFRSWDTNLSLQELRGWTRRFYISFYFHPRRWRYLLTLKHLPRYVLRQVQILLLISRLALFRFVRRRYPAFLLVRYPHAKNGGPGGRS